MSIELLAISELDGSGIVKMDDELYLVCPPCEKRNLTPVDEAAVQRAILRFAFSSVNKDFASWEKLILYLNCRVRDARQAAGQDLSSIEFRRELIDSAPRDIISSFLDRIENELLP